jgi:hypothetical protein
MVHVITMHTYLFLKYIFLQSFLQDDDFDIIERTNKNFFAEVWLSLTAHIVGRPGAVTTERREFIRQFKPSYLAITHYTPYQLYYGQQSSLYEGTKIYV